MACILHIETSTDVCSVTVSEDSHCIYHEEDHSGPNHAECLGSMVDEALSFKDSHAIPFDAERLAYAKAIVKLMAGRNPQGKSSENYEQTLWDHPYIMSDRKLDIDWPYDVTVAEHFLAKPEPMPYQNVQFCMRHYGKLLNETFEKFK